MGKGSKMTIRQQGGVFGRNPVFNDIEAQGDITADGLFTISDGEVVLNGNQIGGVQVTIADDAFATITPPRTGGGFVLVTCDGNGFPVAGRNGIAWGDWGGSPQAASVWNNGDFDVSTAGPPTGTTGVDTNITLFFGGTAGQLYLENRRGSTSTFQITFL